MSLRAETRWLTVAILLILGCTAGSAPLARAQDTEITRKVKIRVTPTYPELARRMGITGIVKVQITIDKGGTIKNSKLVGGHPLLASAALDAVKKWRYESAAEETTGVVEFRFDPTKE